MKEAGKILAFSQEGFPLCRSHRERRNLRHAEGRHPPIIAIGVPPRAGSEARCDAATQTLSVGPVVPTVWPPEVGPGRCAAGEA